MFVKITKNDFLGALLGGMVKNTSFTWFNFTILKFLCDIMKALISVKPAEYYFKQRNSIST